MATVTQTRNRLPTPGLREARSARRPNGPWCDRPADWDDLNGAGHDRACASIEGISQTRRDPLRLGDHVLVGPRACLTGCTVDHDVFLATGSTVFNGARIGARSEVRVNGVVHLRTRVPPDTTVPIGWIAVGDPAQLFPPDEHERIWAVRKELDFPG